MKRMKKLFEISEQILKLEKIKLEKTDSVYDELIDELSEKEKQIVKDLESDYYELIEFMMKISEYFGYDFENFFGLNYLKLSNDSPELLHVLGLIQNVYEFFNYQDFSALSHDEIATLNDNEYFKKYTETMHCYNDWKYMVYVEFLKLTGRDNVNERHAVSFLSDYGKKEIIGGFINSSAYSLAIEIELNLINKLFLNIVFVGDEESKFEEKKLLFEACLKFIPEKYLAHLREVLIEALSNYNILALKYSYLEDGNELLKKYKIEPIKLEEIRNYRNKSLTFKEYLDMSINKMFSLEEIKNYDGLLNKLIDVDEKILKLYLRLLFVLFELKNYNEASKIIFSLKELLRQEQKLYQNVDVRDFKEYVYKVYSVVNDYCPFDVLKVDDLLSKNNTKELILKRIFNYSVEDNRKKKIWFEDDNSFGINLDVLFIEQDIDLEKFLFWQDMYNLGKIDKKQLLEEQKRLGFNFEKVEQDERDEYVGNVFEKIEHKFWDNLMQSEFSRLLCQYFFVRNEEMNRVIFHNFMWEASKNPNTILPFYQNIRREIFKDFRLVLNDYKLETSKYSSQILRIYLNSCCVFLNDEDQIALKKMFWGCEKEVKLRRKKD